LIAIASVLAAMVLMLLWFNFSLFLRWRFQFSIRSLLLLTLAVAVPCSWLAAEMRAAKEQREVVEEIGKLDGNVEYGNVEYDCQQEIDHGVMIYGAMTARYRLINTQSPPEWLRKMLGLDFFATVIKAYLLNSPFVTDTDLEKLKRLNQLKYVNLNNTKITEEGVNRLQQALPNCKIEH
jgi:hypothetical protein